MSRGYWKQFGGPECIQCCPVEEVCDCNLLECVANFGRFCLNQNRAQYTGHLVGEVIEQNHAFFGFLFYGTYEQHVIVSVAQGTFGLWTDILQAVEDAKALDASGPNHVSFVFNGSQDAAMSGPFNTTDVNVFVGTLNGLSDTSNGSAWSTDGTWVFYDPANAGGVTATTMAFAPLDDPLSVVQPIFNYATQAESIVNSYGRQLIKSYIDSWGWDGAQAQTYFQEMYRVLHPYWEDFKKNCGCDAENANRVECIALDAVMTTIREYISIGTTGRAPWTLKEFADGGLCGVCYTGCDGADYTFSKAA